jgi:hypothetical protein
MEISNDELCLIVLNEKQFPTNCDEAKKSKIAHTIFPLE